jgi:hypothetical protein
MASTLVFPPSYRILDTDGNPVSGAQIRFFEAETSTPKVVYSDADLSDSLGSVVYTRSDGFPVASEGSSTVVLVYTGEDSYKIDVLRSDDTTLYPAQDNVLGAPTFVADSDVTFTVPVITTGSNVTLDADDRGVLYNAQANTITFPAATTLGDNWYVHIRNGGSTTGRVVLSAASGIAYQGTSYTTMYLEPGQAISVACDGTAYRAYGDTVLYTPAGFRPNTPGVIRIADRITAEPSTSIGSRYIVSTGYGAFATHDIVEEVASGIFVGYTPTTDCGWIAYVQDEDTYYAFIGSAWVANGLQAAASDTQAGRIEIAVQSEMETPASTSLAVSPGRQHFHPGHPKAGGNLNGTGTPAFAADYGMGAVTDGGAGNYTLAFDTAFADTNYWCTAWSRSVDNEAGSDTLFVTSYADSTKTASSFEIFISDDDGTIAADPTEIGITFWGDYA